MLVDIFLFWKHLSPPPVNQVALPWYGLESEYSRFKNSSISWSSSAKHRLAARTRKTKIHRGFKGIIFRSNVILDPLYRWFPQTAAILGQKSAHWIILFLPIGSLSCVAQCYWLSYLSITKDAFNWINRATVQKYSDNEWIARNRRSKKVLSD